LTAAVVISGATPADRARAVGLGAIGLSVLAVWMVQHRYLDIRHDAIIYSLLALARIHPDPLAADVFLRFGSQDQFTVFSPVFAFMIRHFDLAAAAALMTFISQGALYVSAWLVARRFMSPASALVATGLLIAVPGYYGGAHIFSYTENFMTPRLPAEVLVLGGLAAALSHRTVVAALCILAALLIHPIIASAGVLMLLVTLLAAPRPMLAATVGLTIVLTALTGAVLMPTGPFARFDTEWLDLIGSRAPFLLESSWTIDDWILLEIPVSILALGAMLSGRPMLRTICGCAIVTALSGVALSFLFCDVLHAQLPTRLQMWRCAWIASVLAVLLSPVIVAECWNSRRALVRAALAFLGCGLLMRPDSGAGIVLVLSILSAAGARLYPHFKYEKYVVLGACALLLIAFAIAVMDGLTVTFGAIMAVAAAGAIQRVIQPSVRMLCAFAALPAIACVAATPGAVRSWTKLHYTPELRARFAPWRNQLPANSEVLWPDPLGVWYLLNRQSYCSSPQLAGVVFSRDSAVELDRRTRVVGDALVASGAFAKDSKSATRLRHLMPSLNDLDRAGLSVVCADRDLGYFVGPKQLGPIAMEPVTPDPTKPERRLYIHDCNDYRRQ
jgi:hypothetical protein